MRAQPGHGSVDPVTQVLVSKISCPYHTTRTLDASGVASPAGQQRCAGPQSGVVLVHGAYADGSSWPEMIERLQRAGLTAPPCRIPLTSLADDGARSRRILALHDRPAILSGQRVTGGRRT